MRKTANTGPNAAERQSLEAKLVRYALAGGALLGMPAAGQAGIIYSGVQNLTLSTDQTKFVNIDGLVIEDSSNAGTDFQLTFSPNFTTSVFGPALFNDGLVPLDTGATISLANTNNTGGTLLNIKCCTTYTGPWANLNGPAYLGIRFQISGEDHLGWAQLAFDQPARTLTIVDYAYEDVAGAPIHAGDAPEPSSLLLFATGAAGVLALRRRRNAS